MSASARVQRERRYTRSQPCPICGGWQHGPHGQHCHAFYSADYTIAYCSEIPGDTPANRAGHYAHRVTEEIATHAKLSAKTREPARTTRRRHAVIPASFLDGWHKTMEFPYHNADGSLLYNRVRYDPPAHRCTEKKRVLPFQLVAGEYGEEWAMDEEGLAGRLPLYRWPELLAAPTTKTIFIVEGEKCADALRALGLVATTNPNGAGNWSLILASGSQEALRGHPLVLLPDAGDKGMPHMEEVAAFVADVGASVRVLPLPGLTGKEDVVEWLARGNTVPDLYDLALSTPEYAALAHAAASDDAAVLRAANVELNKRLSWTERVTTIPKAHLSPGAKETALWLRREYPRHARQFDADGYWTLYMPTAAKARGVSASVLGGHLLELDDVGAYRRREQAHLKPNGQRIKRVAIAPGPALDTPEAWLPSAGPRTSHGGARAGAGRPAKCPSCASTNVKIVERTLRVMTCRDCGGRVTQDQIGVDRPVEPSAPDPVRAECPSTGIHLEFRSTDENDDSTDHSRPAPTQKQSADSAILNGRWGSPCASADEERDDSA